jgi:hypothetical protein
MKVMAVGNITMPITEEQRAQIMPKEVPHTLKLYLDGTIEQYWFREDKPGVFFLMSVDSLDKAKAVVGEMPLASEGFLNFEFFPIGPLKPLGLLLQK